ncbi:hypothetical protein WMZ97_15945 [Lentibacillus sp. N15]
MFGIAMVVVVIAFIAIFNGFVQRIKNPTYELKEQVTKLEKRVEDLENNEK